MIRSLGMDLGGDPVGINGFFFFYSWSRVGFIVVNKTNGVEEIRNAGGKMECRTQSMQEGLWEVLNGKVGFHNGVFYNTIE